MKKEVMKKHENEDEVLSGTYNKKKLDSNEEDVTEKNNIHKIYEYDDNSVNDNCDDKPLIVTTEVLGCQWYEDGDCLL